MNTSFMRLLAERLEQVRWVDVRCTECTFPVPFDGVDSFFMATDLVALPGCSDFFSYGNDRVGSIAAWAVQLMREQGGYYDEEKVWTPAPAELEAHEVGPWSWCALGLGKEKPADQGPPVFVMQRGAVDALLSPSFLHGRLRGIGPAKAAAVLRLCADGMAPQDAWALAAQELRESRLRELADVLEDTPHALDAAWEESTPDWSSGDLDRLTHFSMLSRYRPTVMADGGWCGDLSMWAWKLYGADAEHYFGSEANVGLVACSLMGLTPSEGSALFEVRWSPDGEGGPDKTRFCYGLTPALAAYVLRDVADGVFPSYMWDDVQFEEDFEKWLDRALDGDSVDDKK